MKILVYILRYTFIEKAGEHVTIVNIHGLYSFKIYNAKLKIDL